MYARLLFSVIMSSFKRTPYVCLKCFCICTQIFFFKYVFARRYLAAAYKSTQCLDEIQFDFFFLLVAVVVVVSALGYSILLLFFFPMFSRFGRPYIFCIHSPFTDIYIRTIIIYHRVDEFCSPSFFCSMDVLFRGTRGEHTHVVFQEKIAQRVNEKKKTN